MEPHDRLFPALECDAWTPHDRRQLTGSLDRWARSAESRGRGSGGDHWADRRRPLDPLLKVKTVK